MNGFKVRFCEEIFSREASDSRNSQTFSPTKISHYIVVHHRLLTLLYIYLHISDEGRAVDKLCNEPQRLWLRQSRKERGELVQSNSSSLTHPGSRAVAHTSAGWDSPSSCPRPSSCATRAAAPAPPCCGRPGRHSSRQRTVTITPHVHSEPYTVNPTHPGAKINHRYIPTLAISAY